MLLSSFSEVKEYAAKLKDAGLLAWDLETTGLDKWGKDKIIGIALHTEGAGAAYIPVGHGTGSFSEDSWEDVEALAWSKKSKRLYVTEQAYRKIRPQVMLDNFMLTDTCLIALFEAMAQVPVWLAHNAQFDMAFWVKAGLPLPKTIVDTQILAHSLVSNWRDGFFMMPDTKKMERGNETLKWLGRYFELTALNADGVGEEASLATASNALYARLSAFGKHLVGIDPKAHMWSLEAEAVAPYACQDVELTRGLYEVLKVKLEAWGSFDFALSLCEVQRHAAFRMSKTGFKLNTAQAQEWAQVDEKLEELQAEIFTLSRGNIEKPGSPAQILTFLTEICGLKIASTGAAILKDLIDILPQPKEQELKVGRVLELILDYRALQKVVKTYLTKWLQRDGIINPSYNVNGTSTMRWSSSDAFVNNLQNIPKKIIAGISPKKLLLPLRADWCLFEADYSAMEVSIGAWVAETLVGGGADLTLTNMLLKGEDMHAFTRDAVALPELLLDGEVTEDNIASYYAAHRIEAKNPDLVADFMTYCRDLAKIINFQSMYGGGGKSLSSSLGVSLAVGRRISDDWKRAYPAIPAAMQELTRQALLARPSPTGVGAFAYMPYPIFDFSRKYGHMPMKAKSKNGGAYSPRESEARNAYNSIVQGVGGLITVFSAEKVSHAFSAEAVGLHATTHDSITGSCPEEELEVVLPVFRRLMCDWPIYPPLKVEFEVAPAGKGWGYKEGYEV